MSDRAVGKRTFVFVATSSEAWGEVVLARRIAEELAAIGDRAIMLAPKALEKVVIGGPFERVGFIDRGLFKLPTGVPAVARECGADAVILIDAATVMMHLSHLNQDHLLAPALAANGIPLIALDVWNLPATDLTWDFGEGEFFRHSKHTLGPAHRLCPVPFIPPDADGAYCAIGDAKPFSSAEKSAARATLGLGDADRLVLFPTAKWQLPSAQHLDYNTRLAQRLPALLAHLVKQLGPRVRLAHVGPKRLSGFDCLGDRYSHHMPLSPVDFSRLVCASDLLLSVNTAATTITTAIVRDLPTLLVTCKQGGETVDEILAEHETSTAVRDWVADTAPLWPYRVWPMGLDSFLEPLLNNNPYTEAITSTDLLDESRFVEVASALLYEDDARAQALEGQQRYGELARTLPAASTLIHQALEQPLH